MQLPKEPYPQSKVPLHDTFLNGQMLYLKFYNLTEIHSYDSGLRNARWNRL